jgi:uncharacterized protein YdeI (YjbR/CyaY-like superfamily)
VHKNEQEDAMPNLDPRIDAYIAAAPDFARPILTHLRAALHAACPEVEETIKWSMPYFMYQGMLCNMAAFKAHCAFGFWKGALIVQQGDAKTELAMGQFGRITALADLPSNKVLSAYIKQAMRLNADDVKVAARARPAAPRPVLVPADLAQALAANPAAAGHFKAFSPSQQRDYTDWLEDAKTAPTRLRRLETALAWIAEGKIRHWKYAKC